MTEIARLRIEIDEVTPAVVRTAPAQATAPALPKAPEPPKPGVGLAADNLARRIDQFLASRGYTPPSTGSAAGAPAVSSPPPVSKADDGRTAAPTVEKPAEFVCEDDVRAAITAHSKIIVGKKTIITPSARELAEANDIFVIESV